MARRVRNLDGYEAGGVFHPIRGSKGYDQERVGSGPSFDFGESIPKARKKRERREKVERKTRAREHARDRRQTVKAVGALARFVRSRGGIRYDGIHDGEVRSLSSRALGSSGLVSVDRGKGLARRVGGGLKPDRMLEAAKEEGLLPDDFPLGSFFDEIAMSASKRNPKRATKRPLARGYGESDSGTQPTLFIKGDSKHKGQETLEALFAEAEKERKKNPFPDVAIERAWQSWRKAEKKKAGNARLLKGKFMNVYQATKKKNPQYNNSPTWKRRFVQYSRLNAKLSVLTVKRAGLSGAALQKLDKQINALAVKTGAMRAWLNKPQSNPKKRNFTIKAAGKLRIGKNPQSRKPFSVKGYYRTVKVAWSNDPAGYIIGGITHAADRESARAFARIMANAEPIKKNPQGRKNISIKVGGKSQFAASKKGVSIGGRVTMKANPKAAPYRYYIEFYGKTKSFSSLAQAKAYAVTQTDGMYTVLKSRDGVSGKQIIVWAKRRRASPKAKLMRAAAAKRKARKAVLTGSATPQALEKYRRTHARHKAISVRERARVGRRQKKTHTTMKANPRGRPSKPLSHVQEEILERLKSEPRIQYHPSSAYAGEVNALARRGLARKSQSKGFLYVTKNGAAASTLGSHALTGGRMLDLKSGIVYKLSKTNPGLRSSVRARQEWRAVRIATQRDRAAAKRGDAVSKARAKRRGDRKNPNLFEKFNGRKATKTTALNAPDGTPRSLDKLGKLISLHAEKGTIKPRVTVWLCADSKGKLHLASSAARLIEGSAQNFGTVKKIEYETTKAHLDGKPTIYFHHFGEEGGTRPTLVSDGKGGLKFRGGSYKIRAEGIRD